jgi:cephalosporin hydroxylase
MRIGSVDLHSGRELAGLARLLVRRLAAPIVYRPRVKREIVDDFHRFYFDAHLSNGTWMDTYWLGQRVAKCPFDLWIYQELLFQLRPDVIIETGTYEGGGAFYLASLCDLIGKGQVITIDVEQRPGRPVHERITYVTGSSTSEQVLSRLGDLVDDQSVVVVILDSDHTMQHVLNELRLYRALVTTGSYLIVEDTNINGHPVAPEFGPGPMEAVQQFLADDSRFILDKSREKFFLTFNPQGYLRKIAD